MTVRDEALCEAMAKLSAQEGGSIVSRVYKRQLNPNDKALFIGLGGLGCRTVNAIKSTYLSEYQRTDSVRFLAVDSDLRDLDGLRVSDGGTGCLRDHEEFHLFDASVASLLTSFPKPLEVEDWLGDIDPVTLDGTGGGGIRQVGRAMLCGTGKYIQLRERITHLVGELHGGGHSRIHVFILAGLSGGTGSGTFIDVSYMVRGILNDLTWHHIDCVQWGVFFTPEVYHTTCSVVQNPYRWQVMQRNGYAALKELDYFMSDGSYSVDAEPIYRLQVPGGNCVESPHPVFDEGRTFLVSGNEAAESLEDVVGTTAHALLSMLERCDMDVRGVPILSSLYCIQSTLANWRAANVGTLPMGVEAPLGIAGAEFPAFMNYRYLSLGHASVYFPRDEIMAFCASEAMTRINAVWKSAARLDQKTIDRWLTQVELDSVAHVFAKIVRTSGLSQADFRMNEERDAAYFPEITMFLLGMGRVRNTDSTIFCAAKKADYLFSQFHDPIQCEKLAEGLVEVLTSKLSESSFMTNLGPYAGLAALTGYGDIRGACDVLDDLMSALPFETAKACDKERVAEQRMHEQAAILESDRTPTVAAVAVFIDACQEYSIARFERLFLAGDMEDFIRLTKAKLQEYSRKTFGIYAPVMDALSKALISDAEMLMASRTITWSKESYGADAFGLDGNMSKWNIFKEFITRYVDQSRARDVAKYLTSSMFGERTQRYWQDYEDSPQALADEIRCAFGELFRPFWNQNLEKFAVLAYADSTYTQGITVGRLNEIWDADAGTDDAAARDSAIMSAGSAIASMLERVSEPMVQMVGGGRLFGRLYKRRHLTLPEGMNRLNTAVVNSFTDPALDIDYVDSRCKPIIQCTTVIGPIAVPLVKGVPEWSRAYSDARNNSWSGGLHICEVGDWADLLPELCGADAVGYLHNFTSPSNNATEVSIVRRDLELLRRIQGALDRGIDKGYVYFDDNAWNSIYKLINRLRGRESDGLPIDAFSDVAQGVLAQDVSATLGDCIAAARRDRVLDYDETLLIASHNAPLQARQREVSEDPTSFSNLCRIVRSSIGLMRALFAADEEYSGMGDSIWDEVLDIYEKERSAIIPTE